MIKNKFKKFNFSKIKKLIKINKLIFFINGTCKNSKNWLTIKQKVKNYNFTLNKINNKPMIKVLNSSTLIKNKPIIKGILFSIKPNIKSINSILFKDTLNKLIPLLFNFLSFKLNNKIYSTTQIKKTLLLSYKDNFFIHNKFVNTILKKNCKLTFKEIII